MHTKQVYLLIETALLQSKGFLGLPWLIEAKPLNDEKTEHIVLCVNMLTKNILMVEGLNQEGASALDKFSIFPTKITVLCTY